MKAIIYGADTNQQKWEAARRAYEMMLADGDTECGYTFNNGIQVYAQRGKYSITLTVQPEASHERHDHDHAGRTA